MNIKSLFNSSELAPAPAEYAFLLLFIVGLVFTLDPEVNSDGLERLRAAHLIYSGDLFPQVKFSLVQSYLSLPLLYFADIASLNAAKTVAYFNLIVFLLLGLSFYRSISIIYSSQISLSTILLLLSASMMPHHLQLFFGELLSAAAISVGVLLAKRRPYICSALIAVGVANSPALIFPATIVAVILSKKHYPIIMGVFIAGCIFIFENYMKFGSISGSSYFSAAETGNKTLLPYSGLPGFSYPAPFGVLSILFSFGKGIIFFMPGLLLFTNSKDNSLYKLNNIYGFALIIFAVLVVLVYSRWWAWYGGAFWGPRFLLILSVPAALAMAIKLNTSKNLVGNLFLLMILLLSFWVGISGVVFAQDFMELCWAKNYEFEYLCWYVPEFSALWRPFVVLTANEFYYSLINDRRFAYILLQSIFFFYLTLKSCFNIGP